MVAMLTLGSLVAIYGTVQHWTGIDLIRDRHTNGVAPGRYIANGFFDHHLTYGGSVLVLWTLAAAAVAQYGFARDRRSLAAWLALACTSSGLFFSFARSAQLGALAAGILLATTLAGRRRWIVLAAMGLVAALAPLSSGFRARAGDLLSLETEETRLNLWRSAWSGIRERPWTGWGPGNFDQLLRSHEVEGFFESRAHAHSDFLMHWVNAGILGLASSVALLVVVGVLLWRGRHRAGPWAFIPTAGAALQLAFFVGGIFQVYQTDDEVEFALILVLGTGLALVQPPPSRLAEG
jgi:O-antigen ligase